MSQELLKKAAESSLKKEIPPFGVGDTVSVHYRIVEGDKERIQRFVGTVIGRRGSGISETFRVRRIVNGEGVERVFPVHSPRVASVDVQRSGKIRRAKLYFLRDRVGKATRLKEIRQPKKAKKRRPSRQAPQAEAPVEPRVEAVTPTPEGAED